MNCLMLFLFATDSWSWCFTGHCNQVLPLIVFFFFFIDFYTWSSLVFRGFYDSIRNLFIKVSPLSVRLWLLLCTVLHITMQYTSSMQEKNPWALTQSTVFLPGGLNFLIIGVFHYQWKADLLSSCISFLLYATSSIPWTAIL